MCLKPYFLVPIIINLHELPGSTILCCPWMFCWVLFKAGQNIFKKCLRGVWISLNDFCVTVLQESAQVYFKEVASRSAWWLVILSDSQRGHQLWWLALSIIRASSVADCTWLLLLLQVFPLDYILITVITVYFVITSMAGIRNMGIWFFWIRVSKSFTPVVQRKKLNVCH